MPKFEFETEHRVQHAIVLCWVTEALQVGVARSRLDSRHIISQQTVASKYYWWAIGRDHTSILHSQNVWRDANQP